MEEKYVDKKFNAYPNVYNNNKNILIIYEYLSGKTFKLPLAVINVRPVQFA